MAQFPFITDGIIGDVPNNFFPAADPAKGVILHGTPGLSQLCDLPDCTEIRGLYPFGGYLYAVAKRGTESVLWKISSTGSYVEVGTITTSAAGPVWMVANQTQLLVVDGVSGWTYTPTIGGVVQISDADFTGASAASYQDGYGLFTRPSTNYWFFSAINDFTSFDALDIYSKEGKPDNVISILSDHREVWIFGTESVEVWYNAGGDNTSTTNPTFARNAGGLLEFGCGAAKSPASFDNSLAWLSEKGQLLRATGYNAQILSNDLWGDQVKDYSILSDAVAFSYTDMEHEFYQITFPTADVTWVYDAKTKLFFKKSSYKTGGDWGRHRANCYARLNRQHYVGDFENGKIYEMSMDYLDDAGEEIRRVIYSPEIHSGLKRTFHPSVQIEFEPGVGLESGLDPQAMLEYSNDGGNTWSSELWRSVGKIGEYSERAIWHRLGSSYRRMYRLAVADPVKWQVRGVHWWGGK